MKLQPGLLGLLLWVSVAPTAQAKPQLYTDPHKRFRVAIPDGWSSDPQKASKVGAEAVFLGPMQSDDFRVNINIMVQPIGSLEQITKISKDQILGAPGGAILSQKSIQVGSVPGRQIVWKGKIHGRDLQFNSTFACQGGKTYLFTGTSLPSKWSQAAPILAKSAQSFRLMP